MPRLTFWRGRQPQVAVLRMTGVIGGRPPLRSGLTLSSLAEAMERAFSKKRISAVALAINSPGGSPVQSSLLYGRIRSLAEEKELPVFAFVEDVGASGGYWLACAADEIYADANSIVGSIGVVTAGFGLAQAIDRLGVQRRLYTSGDKKAMLDPFLAEKPGDVKHLKSVLSALHDNFKELVRQRRGDKLKGPEKEIFSGSFWTARQALEFGLIDGIGDLRTVMRERFGDKTRFRVYGAPRPLLRRRLGFAGAAPEAWVAQGLSALEERSVWARFGL